MGNIAWLLCCCVRALPLALHTSPLPSPPAAVADLQPRLGALECCINEGIAEDAVEYGGGRVHLHDGQDAPWA